MGRGKPVILESRSFSTKLEAREFFGNMLKSYRDGETISEEDSALLYELVLRHPHATEKLSGGVKRFLRAPAEPRGSAFHIERKDGTLVDFSFHICVDATADTWLQQFIKACRTAVYDDMLAEKTRLLEELEDAWGRVKCPVTGKDLSTSDAEIRHAPPSFASIVVSFIESERIVLGEDTFSKEELQYGPRLSSRELVSKFRNFHARNRRLIVVHKSVPRCTK